MIRYLWLEWKDPSIKDKNLFVLAGAINVASKLSNTLVKK
jgi:hypothetical protein